MCYTQAFVQAAKGMAAYDSRLLAGQEGAAHLLQVQGEALLELLGLAQGRSWSATREDRREESTNEKSSTNNRNSNTSI